MVLSACGRNSNSLVGRWDGGSHQWEFFSDGAMVVETRGGDSIGNWTADGDRLVISGFRDRHMVGGNVSWKNGTWTFTVSRNTFELELSPGRYLEFTRAD